MKTTIATLSFVLLATISFAQTAKSLKARIQEHYTAINSNEESAVYEHHLADFSLFPGGGGALLEPDFEETAKKMGAQMNFPNANVTMKHFTAQIYENTGIATFYLDGSYGEESGIWRVTAVWIWDNGTWKEAHHHESKLIN
jgi:hypothetical protein